MENRIQRLFLALTCTAALAASWNAQAATDPEDLELEPLAVREPDRRQVEVDQLDTEDIEVGVFGGLLSVQDFGSDTVTGLRLAYHITEDFFVEGTYGQGTLGETSFERLSGGAQILTDEERDLSYYNVSLGWNIFPGESFVGGRFAFKGGLYLVGGVGSTDFGGDNRFTINAGVGYRLIATDWLALHVTVRDHFFESDLLGENDTYHNLELTGGLTVFF
jgi:outer membrane beta-barrel protein